MILASITTGEPCRVRAYACAHGSRLRLKLADAKFNRIPDSCEVERFRVEPAKFVAEVDAA